MLSAVTAWIYGEIGAGLIILSLGIYFPHRALINEILNAVASWNLDNHQKFMFGAISMFIVLMPLKLLLFDLMGYAVGLIGIGLMAYYDINASKT